MYWIQAVREDILDDLTDADVRCLVEFEVSTYAWHNNLATTLAVQDELVRRGGFQLIFPLGQESQRYLKYIDRQAYFNLLLFEWQRYQADGRKPGRELLEKLCAEGYHIAQPEKIAVDEAETEEELLDEAEF